MRNFIIGLLLGGGAGGGITYYIMKKQMDGMRDEIRAEYKEYYERKQVEEDEAKAEHINAIPDKPIPKPREYTNIIKTYGGEVRDFDDEDPAESERPEDDEPDDVEDLIEEAENTEKLHNALEKSHDRIKLLQPDSFGEINSYACESLMYYVYDKTLVHEDDTLVDDIAFLVGDALDRYGWADNDEDEEPLYVRNYKLQKDFEVIKVMDEYNPEC